MSKGGGKGTDSRKIFAVFAFLFILGFQGLLDWVAFKRFKDIFGAWFEAMPIFLIGLFALQLTWPIAMAMKVSSSGRKIGDEAEEVARGMQR